MTTDIPRADIDRALQAFYGRLFRFPSGDYHRMGAALAADRRWRSREADQQADQQAGQFRAIAEGAVAEIERLRAALAICEIVLHRADPDDSWQHAAQQASGAGTKGNGWRLEFVDDDDPGLTKMVRLARELVAGESCG